LFLGKTYRRIQRYGKKSPRSGFSYKVFSFITGHRLNSGNRDGHLLDVGGIRCNQNDIPRGYFYSSPLLSALPAKNVLPSEMSTLGLGFSNRGKRQPRKTSEKGFRDAKRTGAIGVQRDRLSWVLGGKKERFGVGDLAMKIQLMRGGASGGGLAVRKKRQRKKKNL